MRYTLLFALIASFAFINPAFAQKSISEASIKYDVDFSGPAADDPTMKAMFANSNMTLSFKDDVSKMLMDMGMMQNIVITGADQKPAVLMDIMGQKYQIALTDEDIEKGRADADLTKFEYLDDAKEIAGYNCKKVVATTGDGNSFTLYVTDKIQPKAKAYLQQYTNLDGFPLQFEMVQNGMRMKMIANTVSTDKLDKKDFLVPDGFKSITPDELQKMFGGGM